MTRETLIERLSYFTDASNVVGAAIYFVTTDGGEPTISFANIEDGAKNTLKEKFLATLREEILENADFHYLPISQADDRRNTIYSYDLEVRPPGLNILDDILTQEERETFNFSDQSLANIDGYLITLGNETNKIALYKKQHSVNVLRRDRFMLVPFGNQLVKIPNDILVLDGSFDFMMIGSTLIIKKLSTLERFHGFREAIVNNAQHTVAAIDAIQLLTDIAQIQDLVQDMTHAKKLVKARSSPVLQVPISEIVNFVRTHPKLAGRIKLSQDGSRLALDTQVSKKLFLKLLNDDYLYSVLTRLQYDTHAKDKLIEETNSAESG